MGDISVQQRIERQRQRRQQRILESAENRLEKIKQFQAARRSPSPESKENTRNTLAEHFPAPSDPRRLKYEMSHTPLNKPRFDVGEDEASNVTKPSATISQTQAASLFHAPNSHTLHHQNWSVFWYFISLEFIINISRMIYQPDFHTVHSIDPLQKPVAYLRLFLTQLYRDLCVVIFMIGFSSIFIPAAQ